MNGLTHLSTYIPEDRRLRQFGSAQPHYSRGTALFADVSGFTELTERLLNHYTKRDAPQQLTHQLNNIYEALIGQVHGYQGIVISFAGDAITCWFEGDYGQRATACALAMQQAMQPFAQFTLDTGETVSLTVKIGLACGPATRFIVGQPTLHYLDVLAGRTLNRMAEAEKLAERGEVILSGEIVKTLNGSAEIAEWRGDFAVITDLAKTKTAPRPWQALSQASQRYDEATLKPWLLPPIYERLMANDPFLDEIRPAAVLFCAFSGLDYDDDPDAPVKLDRFIQQVQQLLAQDYDSYISQIIFGDKASYFYVMIGAPVAHSDDPARAVQAGLDIQALRHEFPYLEALKIGVDYGRFHIGEYGSRQRRTYGGLGDTVNTAARLMGQAEDGAVLVSRAIYESVQSTYQFDYLGTVELKGKRDHLPIWQVMAERLHTVGNAFVKFPDPLLGRKTQLNALNQVLGAMLAEQEQIMMIEAPTGMGKSHLAAAFVEQALRRHIRLAVGVCQENKQDSPYYIWRQIFYTLFNLQAQFSLTYLETQVAQLNPQWALRLPLLGDILDTPIPDNSTTASLDPQSRQDSLFDLVGKILRRLAESSPIVILLEDIHWLDEASTALLHALSRVQRQVPILYLLTQRPTRELSEFQRLSHYSHLSLPELSMEGVSELASYLLTGRVAPLASALIHANTQGVPFFVRELVLALREEGYIYYHEPADEWRISAQMFETLRQANCLTKENGVWLLRKHAPLASVELGIPDRVHSLVRARLDKLPQTSQNTLRTASVIGRVFEFEILQQAHPNQLPRPELRQNTDALQQRQFIQRETTFDDLAYFFRHNIIHQVTYEALSREQEQRLHGMIAEVIERVYPNAVERLAYHYYQAKQVEQAIPYMEQAARKTRAEFANETALQFYQQLLAIEERHDWRQAEIELLHLLGNREAEQQALGVFEKTGPPYLAHYMWGNYYEVIGEYEQAEQKFRAALSYIQTDTVEAVEHRGIEAARCWRHLGDIAYAQGNYEQANAHYHLALGLLEIDPHISNYPQLIMQLFNSLGTVYRQQGDFEGATTYIKDALELSQQTGDKQQEALALCNLGLVSTYRREHKKARQLYEEALQIQQVIGDRRNEGVTLARLAQEFQDLGDYHQTETFLNQGLAILKETNSRWDEVNTWLGLGAMYQDLGVFTEAETCLKTGMELAWEIGDEAGVAYMLVNLGLVERDRKNYRKAKELLTEGVTLAEKQGDKHLLIHFLKYLASVYLHLGDFAQACLQAEKSLALCQTTASKWDQVDNLAILAASYAAQQNIDQARIHVEQTWALLEEGQGEGPEFPQEDYFICYQIFLILDEQRAWLALQKAQQIIKKRAETILNEDLQQSYLQANQHILQAYTKKGTL